MTPLRVLMIEDSEQDAALVLRELRRAGYSLVQKRVDNRVALEQALCEDWDVLLSDFNLPGFDAFGTLEAVAESGKDLPVLVISGAVGEQIAVDLMKSGARDFIRKGDYVRLIPAIERELREWKNREQGRRREKAFEFLAKLGPALAGSLECSSILKATLALAIEQFEGWGVIHFRGEEEYGADRQAELAGHRDSSKESASGFVRKLVTQACELRLGDSSEGHLIEDWSEEFLTAAGKDEDKDKVRELGLRSMICVPLIARGKQLGLLGFVSDSRAYDKQDLSLAENLASRLSLALDNALLFEQSQKSIEVRDEFLSVASHELKTPITSLKLQIDIAKRGTVTGKAPATPERLHTLFETSSRQVAKLTELVENLLDVSRIHSGKLSLDPQELDLGTVVDDSVKSHRIQLASAKCEVNLKLESGVVGNWDRMRIEQILNNLLGNAIKYAPGAPISIEVFKDGDSAMLLMEDSGKGIPKENRDLIFRRFERGMSGRNISGLGLGLYITKQIVEAHQGMIDVQGEPGKGARFIVKLPLAAHRKSQSA